MTTLEYMMLLKKENQDYSDCTSLGVPPSLFHSSKSMSKTDGNRLFRVWKEFMLSILHKESKCK